VNAVLPFLPGHEFVIASVSHEVFFPRSSLVVPAVPFFFSKVNLRAILALVSRAFSSSVVFFLLHFSEIDHAQASV